MEIVPLKCLNIVDSVPPQGRPQVNTQVAIFENDVHGIEKLLLKTQVSEKFLHSKVNLIIQYTFLQRFIMFWHWGRCIRG